MVRELLRKPSMQYNTFVEINADEKRKIKFVKGLNITGRTLMKQDSYFLTKITETSMRLSFIWIYNFRGLIYWSYIRYCRSNESKLTKDMYICIWENLHVTNRKMKGDLINESKLWGGGIIKSLILSAITFWMVPRTIAIITNLFILGKNNKNT